MLEVLTSRALYLSNTFIIIELLDIMEDQCHLSYNYKIDRTLETLESREVSGLDGRNIIVVYAYVR